MDRKYQEITGNITGSCHIHEYRSIARSISNKVIIYQPRSTELAAIWRGKLIGGYMIKYD